MFVSNVVVVVLFLFCLFGERGACNFQGRHFCEGGAFIGGNTVVKKFTVIQNNTGGFFLTIIVNNHATYNLMGISRPGIEKYFANEFAFCFG